MIQARTTDGRFLKTYEIEVYAPYGRGANDCYAVVAVDAYTLREAREHIAKEGWRVVHGGAK